MTAESRVVADIGGTNSRLAVFHESSGRFSSVATFRNSDHSSLEDILGLWQSNLKETCPANACFAIAAPLAGDRVKMVNIGWSFSRCELGHQFGFEHLHWLNDFEANAHALPHLQATDLTPVQPGKARDHEDVCTVGPGTGLGGAALRWIEGRPCAFAAEPGHMGLSPGSDLELAIFRELLPIHGNIYAELLVSGKGLVTLYETIAHIAGATAEPLEPAEVSKRALEGKDPHCQQALGTFCALLGSACGDFLVANGIYGGLYIAGGIAPRIAGFLQSSEFLERMHSKGAMGEHLRATPVSIVTAEYPGLLGAAHAPF